MPKHVLVAKSEYDRLKHDSERLHDILKDIHIVGDGGSSTGSSFDSRIFHDLLVNTARMEQELDQIQKSMKSLEDERDWYKSKYYESCSKRSDDV